MQYSINCMRSILILNYQLSLFDNHIFLLRCREEHAKNTLLCYLLINIKDEARFCIPCNKLSLLFFSRVLRNRIYKVNSSKECLPLSRTIKNIFREMFWRMMLIIAIEYFRRDDTLELRAHLSFICNVCII